MQKPKLDRLIELQKLLLAFSNIDRILHRRSKDGLTPENDTEHSYNLAMTAWFLSCYFPDLDQTLVIKLALAHDILEVHAGDTYIYGDPSHISTKEIRETDALKRLEKEWPDFTELTKSMHTYNAKTTNEAKFVYALDKIMPLFLNIQNGGYDWEKGHITLKMLDDAKREKIELSPEILPYYNELHALLLNSPDIIKPQ